MQIVNDDGGGNVDGWEVTGDGTRLAFFYAR